MRKASRLVKLNDILATEFFGMNTSLITPTLQGHLALEAILVELIQLNGVGDKVWRWSFPKKTKYLVENGIISSSKKEAFDRFNNFRNDFAHVFDHTVSTKEVLEMARYIESAGIDFSDSIGRYSEKEALEYYTSIDGILAEVIWSILFDAAFILEEKGGRAIFAQE
jgi:hypothetical protein